MNYREEQNAIKAKHGARPEKVWVWFAYSKGGSFGPFDNRAAASAISANYEKVQTEESKEQIKAYDDAYNADIKDLTDKFHSELRAKYPQFSDDVYNIIYNMAWERGHSNGYDEVAYYVDEYVDFASQIIKYHKG